MIDHVSLTAGHAQFEELGFHLTPISGSESRARILFDGSYLEVMSPDGTDGAVPSAHGWFLRPANLSEVAEALRAEGIPATGPIRYEGDDGIWLDLTIEGGAPVLPIFTQRVDTPAHGWPPSPKSDHANGTTRISAVHLEAKDPTQLSRVLEAIAVRAEDGGTYELGGGGRVVVQGSRDGREGVVAIDLDRTDRLPLRLQVDPV